MLSPNGKFILHWAGAIALVPQPDQPAPPAKPPDAKADLGKRVGVIAAAVLLNVIAMPPATDGLPRAGQVMLAILAFAVVWTMEALDYAVRALVMVFSNPDMSLKLA